MDRDRSSSRDRSNRERQRYSTGRATNAPRTKNLDSHRAAGTARCSCNEWATPMGAPWSRLNNGVHFVVQECELNKKDSAPDKDDGPRVWDATRIHQHLTRSKTGRTVATTGPPSLVQSVCALGASLVTLVRACSLSHFYFFGPSFVNNKGVAGYGIAVAAHKNCANNTWEADVEAVRFGVGGFGIGVVRASMKAPFKSLGMFLNVQLNSDRGNKTCCSPTTVLRLPSCSVSPRTTTCRHAQAFFSLSISPVASRQDKRRNRGLSVERFLFESGQQAGMGHSI